MVKNGFTLIEILISLALLSLLLLGLDAINLRSLREAKFTWNQHLTELQTENSLERLQAEHQSTTSGFHAG